MDNITKHVRVDRSLTPQQVLDTTGCKQYTNKDVVASMPRGEGDDVDVVFFKVGRYILDDELEKEYELRGLVPADPYSLASVNRDDPAFSYTNINGTHWKNADGEWCSATFRHWFVERKVCVYRRGTDWSDCWWFAGVHKSSETETLSTSDTLDLELLEFWKAVCISRGVGAANEALKELKKKKF